MRGKAVPTRHCMEVRSSSSEPTPWQTGHDKPQLAKDVGALRKSRGGAGRWCLWEGMWGLALLLGRSRGIERQQGNRGGCRRIWYFFLPFREGYSVTSGRCGHRSSMEAWDGEAEGSTASSWVPLNCGLAGLHPSMVSYRLSWGKCCASVPQQQKLHVKAIITLSSPMVSGASHVLGHTIIT